MSTEHVKLFNTRNLNILRKVAFSQSVKSFRTVQVFKCRTCKALTNLAKVHENHNISAICPYIYKPWHQELESKVNLLNLPHPSFYKKELRKEIKKVIERKKPRNNITGRVRLSNKASTGYIFNHPFLDMF